MFPCDANGNQCASMRLFITPSCLPTRLTENRHEQSDIPINRYSYKRKKKRQRWYTSKREPQSEVMSIVCVRTTCMYAFITALASSIILPRVHIIIYFHQVNRSVSSLKGSSPRRTSTSRSFDTRTRPFRTRSGKPRREGRHN